MTKIKPVTRDERVYMKVLIRLAGILVLLATAVYAEEDELITFGAEWRFTESDPGKGWTDLEYDDSGWKVGLGYSARQPSSSAKEDARVPPRLRFRITEESPVTIYFRKKFAIEKPADVSALLAEVKFGGGFAVYLNGDQLASRHLPPRFTSKTLAVEPSYPRQMSVMRDGIGQEAIPGLPPGALRKGENVIAVEKHRAKDSEKLLFDLRLVAHKGFNIIEGPFLTYANGSKLMLIYETDVPCVGKVNYSSGSGGRSVSGDSGARTIHRVELSDLKPGGSYSYEINCDLPRNWPRSLKPIRSEKYPFLVPPLPNKPFRFVVYGDSRTDFKTHTAIAEAILKEGPQLVLNTGDLVSTGVEYGMWHEQFFNPIAAIACKVPYQVVPGNHERNHLNLYYYIFGLESVSWYSFDVGNCHFLVLDMNVPYDEESEQYTFADKDLAKSRAKWKCVLFHQPPRTCVPRRIRKEPSKIMTTMVSLLGKHRVDVVFNGHDHNYARFKPIKGVTYITTGGGGASLYPVEPQDYSEVAVTVHHYCVVEVDGSKLSVKAIDISGKTIDTFSVSK